MGVAASVAKRQMKRPIKNYNIEERAMKVISQDKPTPAPPHPSMRKIMDAIVKDPSKLESSKVDPNLSQNLTKVFITSSGDNPGVIRRKLPVERTPPAELLYGYDEPKVVPKGKASLRQLLDIIQKQSEVTTTDTEAEAKKIAQEYNLDPVHVENIIRYCKALIVLHPRPKPKQIESNPLRRLQDGIDNLKK